MSAALDETPSRREKIRRIFDRFDSNGDGALDRREMSSLVAAVNPAVNFSDEQISSIVDQVFRSYSDFVPNPDLGLSLAGLIQTYADGAGDVDIDFNAVFPNPNPSPDPDPNSRVRHESSCKAVEELENLIRERITRVSRTNRVAKDSISFDGFSDNGLPDDLNLLALSDENSNEFRVFLKGLKEIRERIDRLPTADEAFDGHMAVGRTLDDRRIFKEAIGSFRRAIELKPIDVRAHFRLGNSLTLLGRTSEGKESYLAALNLAESDLVKWSEILPQIHVNLGILMEGEGLLINASEHYRKAVILCPTHYRALKLLGSVLFGIGEYGPAEKALEEAVLLKPDFADAHCDLGSLLHATGDDDRAILSFQKAIDLKADHLDALYNLGGLFKDVGRYQRAAEMYGRVLAAHPAHWQAQLNRAVSLLGAGEEEEAIKGLNEAFKITNRIELYNAIKNLKQLRGKPREVGISWVREDASKFKLADKKTTDRKQLVDALWIRELQRATKLGRCSVDLVKKVAEGIQVPVSCNRNRLCERSIRKSELEIIVRKLLHFLKPETFQHAVKAIDEKIWAVLDGTGLGKIDFGMFFAIIAPLCEGSVEKRKLVAFNALSWRSPNENARCHASGRDIAIYLRYLRVIYFPSQGFTDLMELRGGEGEQVEDAGISHREFLDRFDDPDYGFGVMSTLVKLEAGDEARKCKHSCGVCRYQTVGLMFKETTSGFYLCSSCYSECKVPLAFQKEEYKFKEYLAG